MVHRNILAVVLVSAALGFGWVSVKLVSADTPPATAAELLQQGVKQYRDGDLSGAKATLMKVDAAQLNADQRVVLIETLDDINRMAKPAPPPAPPVAPTKPATPAKPAKPTPPPAPAKVTTPATPATPAKPATPATPAVVAPAPPDPANQLKDADKAFDAGDLKTAQDLYVKVGMSATATQMQKDTAAARLVELRQQMVAPNVRGSLQSLNDAITDIQAGRLDPAEAKLKAIQASKVELGWFDDQRVERNLRLIAERRQQMAQVAQPKPVPPAVKPTPTTPPVVVAPTPQPKPTVNTPPATPAKQPPVVTPVKPAPPSHDALAEAISLAVQEKVAQARAAEANHDYRVAVMYYEQALQQRPDDPAIKAALVNARTHLTEAPAAESPLTQVTHQLDMRRQETVAEFSQLMNKADALRKARNFSGALEAIQNAKIILDQNVDTLSTEQYHSLRDSATNTYAAVDDERIKFEANAAKEKTKTADDDARRELLEQKFRIDQDVSALVKKANELRREQKYDEALQRLNQALFLDPSSVVAQAMKEMVQDTIIAESYEKSVNKARREFAIQQDENEKATIPTNKLMQFPDDWVDLTRRRMHGLNQNGGESEADRRIVAKLGEPIPIDFNNQKLENVIDYIRHITGVNIYTNWPALESAGINKDTPITLQLSSIPAGQALKLVLQNASAALTGEGATYTVHGGLVKISTDADIKATTTFTKVYDIRDLLFTVPNFDNAPDFNLSSALTSSSAGGNGGSSSGSSGGSGSGSGSGSSIFGSTSGSGSGSSSSGSDATTRAAQLKQITDLIENSIGKKEDWNDFGGTISTLTNLNGNLIVKTTPENHQALFDLLDQLRETRTMQVSYETRFLLVVRDLIDDFGLDIDVTFANPGKKWLPFSIMQDSISPTNISSIGNLTLTNPAISLATSFISVADELEVDLLVKATQIDERNVQLTAPRITLMNGQAGFILIATQTAFVSDLEPIPDTGGFKTTVSVVNSGVVLSINGTISADRRYVTMTVLPSLANLVALVNVPVDNIVNLNGAPSATGNTNANGNNNSNNNNSNDNNNNNNNTAIVTGNIQLPILQITQVQATVSVPDKGTILLGGQRLVTEVENEVGVPILSKIPIINRLFTNKSKAKEDRTLLIMVKPTIIIQNEEEDRNFPGLMPNYDAYDKGKKPSESE